MKNTFLSGGTDDDLSHLSPDKLAFRNHCNAADGDSNLRDALPKSSWGQNVLYMLLVCTMLLTLLTCSVTAI